MSSVEAFRARLSEASTKTSALELDMNTTAKNTRESILTALELAVGAKLFKVALYIHGDYDNAQHDPSERRGLVTQMNEAFDRAVNFADDSHQAMGQTHVQINELKSGVVRPLQDELDEASHRLDKYVRSATEELARLQQSSADNAREISRIEEELQQYEILQSPVVDVGMGIAEGFAWIGGQTAKLWGDNGYDNSEKPLELLKRARQALSDERVRSASLSRQISEAKARSYSLQAELSVNSQMQAEMPLLLEHIKQLYSKAGALVELMLQLKEKTVQLSRQAGEIALYASMEVGVARKKSGFTAGILDVCAAAMIDPRLTDEVQMVVDELIKGYEGATLDADLQSKLSSVESSLKLLT